MDITISYSDMKFYHSDLEELIYRVLTKGAELQNVCLLYTSPSPRDRQKSRMPSSA